MTMPVWWPAFMEFANSTAEVQVVVYGAYGVLLSFPLALVGQVFRLVPKSVLSRDRIPQLLAGLTLFACWYVSYHVPQIDRAMLLTWTGLGALGSGKAHDVAVRPLAEKVAERSGVRPPPDA